MRITFVLSMLLASTTAMGQTCPGVNLVTSDVGPAVASGDTSYETDDWLPTCGSASVGSPDYAVEFTAPNDAIYIFDTNGSGFDTSLTAFDTSDCATAIDCDDDGGDGAQSQLVLDLAAGETVVLVIDGFNGAVGTFLFNVEEYLPVCVEDIDLASGLGNALSTGTTCGAGNDLEYATCGGDQASEDLLFRWVAPATDLFTFDTEGSDYDTAITVRNAACDEVECNDDDPALGLRSSITFSAILGETYYLTVDGFGTTSCGNYTLNLNQGCPDLDGDGVCDDVDVCDGDDASGDSDGDGLCDDIDFNLSDPAPVGGSPLVLATTNAIPGATVFFAVSVQGPGTGPCLPIGECLDILSPKLAGSATADGTGAATITVNVPASRAGRTAYFQAVYRDSLGATDKTEVDTATVQ